MTGLVRKTPVVISTAPGREHWVADCLGSFSHYVGGRELLVVSSIGWETGVIRWVQEHTDFDRWLLLQDSVVVDDADLFHLVDQLDTSAALFARPHMYMAAYDRKVLDKLDIPLIRPGDKEGSISAEVQFLDDYSLLVADLYDRPDLPVMFPDVHDGAALGREFRHGRDNLVLGNRYIRKFKGTWR